jgi:transglutaminase-like putative cysteine protease
MVRLKISIELAYHVFDTTCEFVFNIHPAINLNQHVVSESVSISQDLQSHIFIQEQDGTRIMRLRGNAGPLVVRYEGVVDIQHVEAEPEALKEMAVADLPLEILSFVYPSRYCQSDRFRALANHEFGSMQPGYQRVRAICDWVNRRTKFITGSSGGSTSALETLTDHAGVCRDFAHLMITICRALNIPARFVSGIDYGADPILGPTDFHAYVEVYLSERWYLFDPSGVSPTMGLPRLGTGRDAADVSFATVFGAVASSAPLITIDALVDSEKGLVLPGYQANVLSSCGAPVTFYRRLS